MKLKTKMAAPRVARFARICTLGLFTGPSRSSYLLGKQAKCLLKSSRSLHASTDSLSFMNVEKQDGFSIVELKRKPVNSLNMEMLIELRNVIDELESNESCQGLILTSGLQRIFCAGLEITEMVQPKVERLTEFWHSFQNVWLKLYGSRLATVAAINGASPAAGCLLAVACDYRIMADGFVIGPNETQLGIAAPPWFMNTLVSTVGHRKTELMLSLGQLLSSKDALAIGLVDHVLPQNEVLDGAKMELKKWLAIPADARYTTKIGLRGATLEKLQKGIAKDTKHFLEFVSKESTQQIITGYLKRLGEKSKK